ncbi:unnamed protein product [Dovyalis caffra]|uniref:EamA domain-containing protein n=1 Tax=Dovyalis caffra TaxID=77055 RepID=A0AAV1SC64_9ROSI|nr:unnamed protein product [Dovyalis caffra]
MAASAEISDGDHDAVELIVCDVSASAQAPDEISGDGAVSASEEITPLLKPKINIFSVSHSRRKPREQGTKLAETETFPVTQFVLWIWGGSRYSGLSCVAVSSIIYFVMEMLSDFFSAQPIPLFETAFTRCTITLILSYLWLRRNGQPIFGPAHARKHMFSRALTGCLSLLSFIYCIQRLPLSQSILLSFTTPIMASIAARIILHEKLKIANVGGLACSFFGVLFIFRQILTTQGALVRAGETNYIAIKSSNHVLTVLVGLFSSITGGISYCLLKAGAKASDQPLTTVFSFGMLTTPATVICTFAFEDWMCKPTTASNVQSLMNAFTMPTLNPVKSEQDNDMQFILNAILEMKSFSSAVHENFQIFTAAVEVFLARGLQLENISKAANVLYMEAALSQLWGIGSLRVTPSFGGLVGSKRKTFKGGETEALYKMAEVWTAYVGLDIAWKCGIKAGVNGMADIISHPPMEQLQDLEYCIDSNPPWAETVILAFQNYIVMLGTSVMIPSVLVPAMGGTDGDKARVIQTLLFVAGINTLLQALFGTRLPAVVGGSYAYVIPIAYIISDSSLQRITDGHDRFIQTMRAIQGALIVASSIQIILGYSQVWGLFSRFFSPLGMAPVVGLVGLGLFQRGFPALGNCVEIGIPMLLLVIGLSQYLKHIRLSRDFPIFERFPVLICIAFVWIYAVILTASGAYREKRSITQHSCRTDRANLISAAPWFKFPYPLQWGPPTFSAGHSFAMMSAVLVSMVESTGAYKAASRLAIATPPPAYVLSRGIGWQGIGIMLDGLFGTGTGSTVSVENVGLLGLTRVGSRRVVQISAGFMIFFSILGKFGAVFASIPFPIFAALYCVLFGLVASVGLSFLQFTNMNSMRNLIITGLSLFLGISVPQFFNEYWNPSHNGLVHTNAGWFNAFLNTIFSSPATVGLIVAVFLDNTLEVERSKKDRGMPWWANKLELQYLAISTSASNYQDPDNANQKQRLENPKVLQERERIAEQRENRG